MTQPLLDAQERREVVHSTYHNIFVEAGAGTGKTTVMVARIVELVASGRTTIDAIAAITFTEAAAGELRERIRLSLEQRRAGGNETESARCNQALSAMERASIGTIHGFAQRLLALHAVRIGVPPGFEVRDRVTARLEDNQRWQAQLRMMFTSMDGLDVVERDVIALATALGLRQSHLHSLVALLRNDFYRFRRPQSPSPSMPSVDLQLLIKRIERVLALSSQCTDPDDKLLAYLNNEVAVWAADLGRQVAGSVVAKCEALSRCPQMRVGRSGRKGAWPQEPIAEIRQALTEIRHQTLALLEAPRQWALSGVVVMLGEFVLDEAQRRRQSGQLDFQDLLVLALELAHEDEVVRAVQERYEFIFVDEFQDTDGLQVALINLLAGSGGDQAIDVFTVGDEKQSIYRFRGADLAQFQAVRAQRGAGVAALVSNFRSGADVIDWVNETFAPLLSSSLGQWTPLHQARSSAGGGVEIFGEMTRGARAKDVRDLEATTLVDRLYAAKSEGWTVGEGRPIRYGDMAVLMPTRRSLPALERALRQAEVPYRVESRSLIWVTQEISDVAMILRAIANPYDQVAVVAALRTAALACGDDELYAWRQSDGSWNYLDADVDDVHPIGVALGRLKALHDRHRWRPVSQFVAEVIAQLRMYELAFARPRQREAWHRLRFVVDRARAWTEQGGFGLAAFVDWMTEQADEAADALESVVPEADDDAVRIMTIHASKGLEFPLVGLVGLGARETNSDSTRLLWQHDQPLFRIGNKDGGWQTPGFAECDEVNKVEADAEQLRLLYVACTRASDCLLVSLYGGSRNYNGSLAQKLSEVTTPSRPDFARMPPTVPVTDDRLPSAGSTIDRNAVIRTASRPRSLSATTIAGQIMGLNPVLPSAKALSDDNESVDLAHRLAFGSAVHNTLEVIDFDASPSDVDALCIYWAEQHGLADHATDVAHSVSLALSSSLVAEAAKARGAWREVPVYTTVGSVVVGGTIDLLFDNGDGLVIVDYKTESLEQKTATEAAGRYRWQLVTYAYACRAVLNKHVTEAQLLFVPARGETSTVSIGPVEALLDEFETNVVPLLR